MQTQKDKAREITGYLVEFLEDNGIEYFGEFSEKVRKHYKPFFKPAVLMLLEKRIRCGDFLDNVIDSFFDLDDFVVAVISGRNGDFMGSIEDFLAVWLKSGEGLVMSGNGFAKEEMMVILKKYWKKIRLEAELLEIST
ncbi:MAG: hypothetical protein WC848_02760 [Parcubacteria group bacterium]|jgi:hypothetical protein